MVNGTRSEWHVVRVLPVSLRSVPGRKAGEHTLEVFFSAPEQIQDILARDDRWRAAAKGESYHHRHYPTRPRMPSLQEAVELLQVWVLVSGQEMALVVGGVIDRPSPSGG